MSPELSVEECIISESISSILAYGMLTACNLRETHCDVVIFCLSGLSCRCEEEQALQMRNIDAAPVIITLMIGIVIVSADVRTLLALDAAPPGRPRYHGDRRGNWARG